MHHHRSDDLPPYLVIVIIGHVVLGGFMMTDMVWPLPLWLTFAIWTPITILAALLVIQPIKGGVIGLQWALRMHGFGGHERRSRRIRDPRPPLNVSGPSPSRHISHVVGNAHQRCRLFDACQR